MLTWNKLFHVTDKIYKDSFKLCNLEVSCYLWKYITFSLHGFVRQSGLSIRFEIVHNDLLKMHFLFEYSKIS